jgi:L-ribulokinase
MPAETSMPYTLGFDFGSESGRAVLVDVRNGREIASQVVPYTHGVIEHTLPGGGALGRDWALQHPLDYLEVLERGSRGCLRQSKVRPEEVIGIGTDFTACTMLPTRADGTPLCLTSEWKRHPHAWIKLWKHHAAQGWADRLNALARERQEPWLATYGGKISSEWLFPKVAQIADEAPEVYDAAERFIEAADWIVWQLTGRETRNACTAGYKAIWDDQLGYPSREFCAALHPKLVNLVDKLGDPIALGQKAGELTPAMAKRLGLKAGTAVAIGNVDAHVSVPACGVGGADGFGGDSANGVLVAIMGTSCCDILCGPEKRIVPGMCGVVKDGVVPGSYGFEAGQSGFGDHFAWLSRFLGKGDPGHATLERQAAVLGAGGSGLLSLDWWNGNRSVLVDADLTGLLLGLSLHTTPAEVYRALIEGLAFGLRMIIDTFVEHGVRIDRIIACGGLAEKNQLFMQVVADVCQRPIQIARSAQAPAVGSAIFAALAAGSHAGGYDALAVAARAMGGVKELSFAPIPANRAVYDRLFAEYRLLHDHFGRTQAVMKRLKAITHEASTSRAATSPAQPAGHRAKPKPKAKAKAKAKAKPKASVQAMVKPAVARAKAARR